MSVHIQQIKQANSDANQHFFDDDTMRFFKSIIYPRIYGDKYFVTSEKGPDNVRRFTVRVYDAATGGVETFGEHGDYTSKYWAEKAAEKAASK